MHMSLYQKFPSIPRLTNERMIITEKIDGMNVGIIVLSDGSVLAQSRDRVMVPTEDDSGFAQWVEDHKIELRELGVGYHYGERWGYKIHRTYDRTDRSLSLFIEPRHGHRPPCCGIVPVLYEGPLDTLVIDQVMTHLLDKGSVAAPGYMRPE